jgi:hypothetical protein
MRARGMRGQRGSTLLIIIGIAATLAIMASTLVVVVGNMQANTADTRTRTKAAGVGEAAMDGMMYQLALDWPATATTQPALDTSTIDSQFSSTTEFPRPASGQLVQAVYYDNSDTNGDGKVDRNDAHWDANGDQEMYVESQGNVGGRSARFQALVQRTFVDTTFPRGIAVYDGGNLDANGGGNNPKIHIYDQGDLTSVMAYVNGDVPDAGRPVFQSSISTSIAADGDTVPPLDELMPDTLISQVIAMAKGMGRYYDLTQGASMPSDLSGVCVIKVADGSTVSLGNNGGINSREDPGILFVLGGPHVHIDIGGTQDFYGVFYTEGQLDSAHGTPAFYGMVICTSYMDMRGTADIYYDDSAIVRLQNKWTLTVKLVPNTWREIQPQ